MLSSWILDGEVQSCLQPWARKFHVPLQGSGNANGLEPRDTTVNAATTRILFLLLLLLLLLGR